MGPQDWVKVLFWGVHMIKLAFSILELIATL